MTHLHIDCFSGISGDMFLGAFVDAGLPLASLKRGLKNIKIEGYQVKAKKVLRGTIRATKVDILVQSAFRKPLSLPKIRRLISTSQLPSVVKTQSLQAFHKLAEAEAAVHGVPIANVHFHEVGVVDSFIDIVGAFLACAYFQVESVSASPVNVGSGTIESAHGTLPVPGPAVAHLAKGIPIFANGPSTELTTPTGMGILSVLTQEFRTLSAMSPHRIGYGAGTNDPEDWPNIVRVFMSELPSPSLGNSELVVEVQTNVDDLNPQVYEALMDRLFAAGALDVTLTPVIMKRSRPGTIVTILVPPVGVKEVTQILFEETTTLGVRRHDLQRLVLPRDVHTLRLPGGRVRMKVAELGRGRTKITPEYQDCKKIAENTGRPVREIIEQAHQAYTGQKRRKKP